MIVQAQSRAIIRLDHRELRSLVLKYLHKEEFEIKIINKQPVDFIINEECGIERKTVKDFMDSLIDGRLFRQVKFLKENFKNPLLVLEGGGLYSQKSKLKPNVIRGALIWTSLEAGVPVIRTYGPKDSAEVIMLLAKRFTGDKFNYRYNRQHSIKKFNSHYCQKIYLLQSIRGVGLNLAKNLVSRFGSIGNIARAPLTELADTRGIGCKKAEYIKKVFED